MSVQPVTRAAAGVGFAMHEVIVESLVLAHGMAICRETSTQHLMEVLLLPLRVRLPQVGERWIVDVTYGSWSFAALLSASDLLNEVVPLSQAAGWARANDGIGARQGVVYTGVSSLISATTTTDPTMTVTVAALHFIGPRTTAADAYLGSSPEPVTIAIAPAPPSGLRVDLLYAVQRDGMSTTAADSLTQGVVSLVSGAAGAVPALPAGTVELGTVTVPAGATTTASAGVVLATTCAWTAPLGSPIPVRNVDERNALSKYDGLSIYRLDTHHGEHCDGLTWLT